MYFLRSLAAAAVLALATPAFAQMAPPTGAPGGGGQMDPRMQALMAAQMQVVAAQKKAIADPVLKAELDKLQDMSEKAMLKADPSLKASMKSYHALEAKLNALSKKPRNAENGAVAQKLMGDLRPLAQKLGAAQKKTLDKPEIRKAFEAFDAKVQKKMAEIDPQVPALIKKLEAASKAAGAKGGMGGMHK